MDVGSEPDVVGQIPTDVIGIVIDDDVVRIPEPAITVTDIIRSHGEVKTAEPEAAGTTASEAPYVAATETAGEAAMLPGVIHMVVSVIAACVMADPLSTVVHVRSIGMSFLVVEMAVFLCRMRSGYSCRTVLWNVLMSAADLRSATAFMAAVLCQR